MRPIALLLLQLIAAGTVPASPRVTFEASTISISDVSAKGSVYAFGVAREPRGDHTSVVPRETILSDDDADGIVTWTLPAGVAVRSIWVAVDLTSGSASVATPPGYEAKNVDLTDVHLKKDATEAVARLAFPGTLVEIVVIRPGAGVWRETVGLHGPQDETTDSEKVTISIAGLQPQAGTKGPAPEHLEKGDVVFFLDSYQGTYGLAIIGE